MSIKVMTRVWESKLESTHKLVMLCLADYADDNGCNVFPRVITIATRATISERTAQRILKDLVSWGIIAPVGRTSKGTVQYKISLTAVSEYNQDPAELPENASAESNIAENRGDKMTGDKMSPLPKNDEKMHDLSPLGDTHDTPGVTSTTSRGDIAMSPDPFNNHQLNHQLTVSAVLQNFAGPPAEDLGGWSGRLDQLWTAILGQLRVGTNGTLFAEHIKPSVPVGAVVGPGEQTWLVVACPSERSQQWCVSHLDTLVDRMITGISGGKIRHVEFGF